MSSPALTVPGGAIDVHVHFLPASYREALERAGMDRPDNIPGLPDWSLSAAIDSMDELGIASAILSISSPGVAVGTRSDTVALARTVNDDGAEFVREASDRFGLFASLPLPHLEDALEELRRAYDELDVDGFVMLTNAGGRYVSEPEFRPLLEEMDRRDTIVLLHPASPPNHEAVSFGRPTPMIEFPFETTRAVIDLILSGAIERFPRIRWIVPHAGAALPVLASRVALVSQIFRPEGVDVQTALGELYYDLAGDPLPIQLPALIALVGTERLLYGSDLPFTPTPIAMQLANRLASTELLYTGILETALRATPEKLFPRLAREPSSFPSTETTPLPSRGPNE